MALAKWKPLVCIVKSEKTKESAQTIRRVPVRARQSEVSTHSSMAYGSIIAKPSCSTYAAE